MEAEVVGHARAAEKHIGERAGAVRHLYSGDDAAGVRCVHGLGHVRHPLASGHPVRVLGGQLA